MRTRLVKIINYDVARLFNGKESIAKKANHSSRN